jgi:hypothetical protein
MNVISSGIIIFFICINHLQGEFYSLSQYRAVFPALLDPVLTDA